MHTLARGCTGMCAFCQRLLLRRPMTQDAIDRINGLEASGRLTGVMDERGKVRMPCAYVCVGFCMHQHRKHVGLLCAQSHHQPSHANHC